MTTQETVKRYLDAVAERQGLEGYLADGVTFTSRTSPEKQLAGKQSYLEATRRFYSTVVSLRVRDLIVDGDRACALTHYELQAPGRPAFASDVAEVFTVRGGKIDSLAIYFDPAPYPK